MTDEYEYLAKTFGLMQYHIEFLNGVTSALDLRGKNVLEIGGANYPEELVINRVGAKRWVCVDKPWAVNDVARKNHFDKHKFYQFNNADVEKIIEDNSYVIFNEYSDDIPDTFFGKFDAIVSNCAIEHIVKLPLAIDICYKCLKKGGYLFMQGAPIWSSKNGSHIYITDKLIHSELPKELEFSHLLYGYKKIHQLLIDIYDREFADNYAFNVKESNCVINHLFFEDYCYICKDSRFKKIACSPLYTYPVEHNILKQLRTMYPGYKRFDVGGVLVTAYKETN